MDTVAHLQGMSCVAWARDPTWRGINWVFRVVEALAAELQTPEELLSFGAGSVGASRRPPGLVQPQMLCMCPKSLRMHAMLRPLFPPPLQRLVV